MQPEKYAAEAALVEALCNDDPGAWKRYKDYCGNLVVKVLGSKLAPSGLFMDVADLHQEVLIKALATWDGSRSSFKTWIVRIALQLANNHLTKVSRRRESAAEMDVDNAPPTDDDPYDALVDRIDCESQSPALRSAIMRLPQKQRQALVLRYYLGWKDHEIARKLQVPEGSVRVYIFRALQGLKQTLPGN